MGLIRNDLPNEAPGVALELRRMNLPRNLLQRYGDLAAEAVHEMERIETGEIANVDEGRRVGHYWLRDPARAPREFQQAIPDTWKAVESFAAERFHERFENILWIGIGGSGLAPQMLYDALRQPGRLPRMFFFDNTDPSGFDFVLAEIEALGGLDKTLAVVVSKSGSTPETYNGMFVAEAAFRSADVDFASHAVAITQPGSRLDREAADWLARFPIWDWVGGRTSLFSPVGLLPACLIGGDIHELLAGAREMDQATRGGHLHENIALLMAVAWFHAVETCGLRNMVVLPYCDRLSLLGKYLQQLVMESVGKDGKGISVFGNKGSTDQHSYVQQLREGYADFFALFVRTKRPARDWDLRDGVTVGDYLAAFQEGTAQALSEAGRPSMRLTLREMDARTLGALVALFERAVGFYGAILGVNAYHQPGVEAGKKAAQGILEVQQSLLTEIAGPERTVAELAQQVKASIWLVFDILDRLAECERYGVVRVGEASLPIGEQVFAVRR